LLPPFPADIDFMHASAEELATLRRAIHPLARRMAARLAKQRQSAVGGKLDFRSTVRHSLSYGGVPVEPRLRRPSPAKPEIVILADVSGSVAAFARFTLQLVCAISAQFSAVRSFVFIDGVDEVTRNLERAEDPAEAFQQVAATAEVTWVDGHSNYGHALEAFWGRWGPYSAAGAQPAVTARTTVLILGDARNNYHHSSVWVLAALQNQARRLYWLNPEPRSYWDTGDSIASEYASHCDGVYECRNLRQLEHFVEVLR
jgi:uncharacterized protein with von Willebrand factor type A (vWA) domain